MRIYSFKDLKVLDEELPNFQLLNKVLYIHYADKFYFEQKYFDSNHFASNNNTA